MLTFNQMKPCILRQMKIWQNNANVSLTPYSEALFSIYHLPLENRMRLKESFYCNLGRSESYQILKTPLLYWCPPSLNFTLMQLIYEGKGKLPFNHEKDINKKVVFCSGLRGVLLFACLGFSSWLFSTVLLLPSLTNLCQDFDSLGYSNPSQRRCVRDRRRLQNG